MDIALIGIIGFGVVMLFAGVMLFYAIGVCSRCGHHSFSYICPNCKRGRYDYTD